MDEMKAYENEEMEAEYEEEAAQEATDEAAEAEDEVEVSDKTTMNQSTEFLRKFAQNFTTKFVISPAMFQLTIDDYKEMKKSQGLKLSQQKAIAQKEINSRKLSK